MFCSQCGEQLVHGVRFCSHCGTAVTLSHAAFQNGTVAPDAAGSAAPGPASYADTLGSEPTGEWTWEPREAITQPLVPARRPAFVLAVCVLLGLVALVLVSRSPDTERIAPRATGSNHPDAKFDSTVSPSTASAPGSVAPYAAPEGPAVPPSAPSMTSAQRNAVRSAESYLQLSGFSKQGLIDQLSSQYGDRYSVADAAVAVESLNVDWSEQAARSAQNYLAMSGFSCRGLIDQLSSRHGDKYTAQQAAAGAKRAGACP